MMNPIRSHIIQSVCEILYEMESARDQSFIRRRISAHHQEKGMRPPPPHALHYKNHREKTNILHHKKFKRAIHTIWGSL